MVGVRFECEVVDVQAEDALRTIVAGSEGETAAIITEMYVILRRDIKHNHIAEIEHSHDD